MNDYPNDFGPATIATIPPEVLRLSGDFSATMPATLKFKIDSDYRL
nr:MAG TPA: hypothetical protein [Caudoviricetes sp.]